MGGLLSDSEVTATTAQSRKGEYWYVCEVCGGRPKPKSKTTRNVRTHEQEGLRVCKKCKDDPGRDDMLHTAQARLQSAARREGRPKPP